MSETIVTKQCSKCKEIKVLSEFCKQKSGKYGHRSECKNCQRIYNRIYDKQYRQTENGKEAHKRARHKYAKSEKGKTSYQLWRHSEKGKAYTQTKKYKCQADKRHKLWALRHPIKQKAHEAVKYAIESGKLPRANSLQCHYYLQNPDCEKQAQHYHHWHGYEKEHWLDVVPVCTKCHGHLSPSKANEKTKPSKSNALGTSAPLMPKVLGASNFMR